MRITLETAKRNVAGIALGALALSLLAAPVIAATTNANAAANANANADPALLLNSATSTLNTPEGRAAVQAAGQVAASPELHVAVKSFWRKAWDASWPFLSGMVKKFFGLFVIAWDVLTRQPTGLGANANANANVNATVNVNAH